MDSYFWPVLISAGPCNRILAKGFTFNHFCSSEWYYNEHNKGRQLSHIMPQILKFKAEKAAADAAEEEEEDDDE